MEEFKSTSNDDTNLIDSDDQDEVIITDRISHDVSVNSNLLHFEKHEQRDKEFLAAGIISKYSPASLQKIFEAKLDEIAPALKTQSDKGKLLYALERLCKNFLVVVLREKPQKIQMSTMNLNNFDKAVNEVYEFNGTLSTSIDQLYVNRNKLNVTINNLIEFCLHIDTEQYGYIFTGEFKSSKDKEKFEKDKIKEELQRVKNEAEETKGRDLPRIEVLNENSIKGVFKSNLLLPSHRSTNVRHSVAASHTSLAPHSVNMKMQSQADGSVMSDESNSDDSTPNDRSISYGQRKMLK